MSSMVSTRIILLGLAFAYSPLVVIGVAINSSLVPAGEVPIANVTTDVPTMKTDGDAQPLEAPPIDLTPLTCRWSNCNEQCAPGYAPVPRQGGKPNEMMWDHTHCMGTGLQLFCCPNDIPKQPVCTWRGHKNSGHCTSGCRAGEVEVGTLDVGCKTEHQSACCTDNVATLPYGECRWYGAAPECADFFFPKNAGLHGCTKEFPNLILQAKAGFGGEKKCAHGNRICTQFKMQLTIRLGTKKSYCCKGKPQQFQNCEWQLKFTKFLGKGVCEASCPPDQIKIGMDSRPDCKSGEGAYCCAGVRPPPPPEWVKEVDAFRHAAEV